MIPVSLGAVAGLFLSALIGRVFASLLAGVSPLDPLTYTIVAITMLSCAMLAALSGAWRVRFILPAEALRTD
jgi:ABC-type antimicrobial peptide transport system permease subunit